MAPLRRLLILLLRLYFDTLACGVWYGTFEDYYRVSYLLFHFILFSAWSEFLETLQCRGQFERFIDMPGLCVCGKLSRGDSTLTRFDSFSGEFTFAGLFLMCPNVSETTCASSAILPNLTFAAVDRKILQVSPSVDRLFHGSQKTLACVVTSLLHLFAHLSLCLISNVSIWRFYKSVRSRGMTHATRRGPQITEARARSRVNT
jgi:hypothetical protein